MMSPRTTDVVVVGGGHNGLVCAAYLAKSGLAVTILEARSTLGGPVGSYEFMDGYRASFTNSPGSFEARVLQELDLTSHGLTFVRPDPTLIHPFDDNETFVGWRDSSRVDEQFNRFAEGEAGRYRALIEGLDSLGAKLGHTMWEPSCEFGTIDISLCGRDRELWDQILHGSLSDLLDEHLKSDEAKSLLTMLAINGQLVSPKESGSAVGLLLRPISRATGAADETAEAHVNPLRGSVGLPVGSMSAIIDALEDVCRCNGVEIVLDAEVEHILIDGERVSGVSTISGREFLCTSVVSTIAPSLFDRLVQRETQTTRLEHVTGMETGSAFKIALALDGLPDVIRTPLDLAPERALQAQFRIGPSTQYIETAVHEGIAGQPSYEPIMWGLIPSLTSPGLAPTGNHLMSVNVWHAPHSLGASFWPDERESFGQRCISVLDRYLPGLADRVIDHRFIDPIEIESDLRLVASNITHGDMALQSLFGDRIDRWRENYTNPISGLFQGGSGVWPGGYVTGAPGRNASYALLAHRRKNNQKAK